MPMKLMELITVASTLSFALPTGDVPSIVPFADMLQQLAFELLEVDLAFFCSMSWRLWGEQNNISHGKVISSSESILELGMTGLGEWSNVYH
ncbi:hypothetical protein TIFTF001_030071 [Ficus carica]|uniref:Secreted protein n=1 Tax=Ficus carica TaxID=3494 RepID=A0AA88J4D8_FICCA|nr:hypothetical protein TIFTF001_030071 [Ficus carica]